MKSRIAVSFSFILAASIFTSDAAADLRHLGSWAGGICRQSAIVACVRAKLHEPLVGETHISLVGGAGSLISKPAASDFHCGACQAVKAARKQMHEALSLMRME